MVSLHEEQDNHVNEDTKKAHATGEFVKWWPCAASNLATVVRLVGRHAGRFWQLFYIQPPVSVFLFLTLDLMVDSLRLFHKVYHV